jgi:hypothetical protein
MTLVNLSGFVRGIPSDETALNIRSFRVVVEPEFKEYLNDRVNEARGFAVGAPMRTVTMEGEISANSGGVMSASFTSAFAPANTVNYFGAAAGGLYLDRGEVGLARDGWKDLTAEFSSRAGIN